MQHYTLNLNREYTLWDTLDFFHVVKWEIEITKIKPFLPQGITAQEVRPGVGIFAMGIYKFREGSLGYIPRSNELSFNFVVGPFLGKPIFQPPSYSFFTHHVGSNTKLFLEKVSVTDEIPPLFLENLKVITNCRTKNNNDPLNIHVEDDNGPIVTLVHKPFSKDMFYQPEKLYCQNITSLNYDIYKQQLPDYNGKSCSLEITNKIPTVPDNNWSLSHMTFTAENVCIHQKKNMLNFTFYPEHPFFMGLEVSTMTDVYIQAVLHPQAQASLIFYNPIHL